MPMSFQVLPRIAAAAAFAALAGASTGASATVYSFEDSSGRWTGGGILTESFSASYDTDRQLLDFSATVNGSASHATADGFWLVLSDGPNPKTHVNEYAILYGDAVNNRLTAYVYDGVNSADSYRDVRRYITSYSGVLDYTDLGGGRSSFSVSGLDVSTINAYTPWFGGTNDWDGVAFGENIGVWFHPAMMDSLTYACTLLVKFNHEVQGWYDFAGQPTNSGGTSGGGGSTGGPSTGGGSTGGGSTGAGSTGGSSGATPVPEPAALGLLLLGMLGLAALAVRGRRADTA